MAKKVFNWNMYVPCYEEAKRVEQERIKDGLRGCKHLEECFDEMMEV